MILKKHLNNLNQSLGSFDTNLPMFFLFIYAPVYVTMRHAVSPMYYFCHVIDYKVIRN